MKFLDIEIIGNLFSIILSLILISILSRGISLHKRERIMLYIALVLGVVKLILNIISL